MIELLWFNFIWPMDSILAMRLDFIVEVGSIQFAGGGGNPVIDSDEVILCLGDGRIQFEVEPYLYLAK